MFNKAQNINGFLICFTLFVAVSCFPSKGNPSLQKNTMTGRFIESIIDPNDIKNYSYFKFKKLNDKQLKLLEKDLNFISNNIRKFNNSIAKNGLVSNYGSPYPFSLRKIKKIRVKVIDSISPNVNIDIHSNTIEINSGLIRKVFIQSSDYCFKNIDKYQNESVKKENMDDDDFPIFSIMGDELDSLHLFFDYIYNSRPPKIRELFSIDSESNALGKYYDAYWKTNFIDTELGKILSFIISHEFYHIIDQEQPCQENEIKADAYALLMYKMKYEPWQQNDLNSIFKFELREFTGRDITELFYYIYDEARFKDGDICHLNLNERQKLLENMLNFSPSK